MENAIIEIERQQKYWTEQRKALLDGLMQEMAKAGAYAWESDRIRLTRKKDYVRETFDKDKLREEHPDIYAAYVMKTITSGSITLKIK